MRKWLKYNFSFYPWWHVRPIRALKQLGFRIKNGWWEYDCWNLDESFYDWVIPRLKHLKKTTICYPAQLGDISEWHGVLDQLIEGFEVCREDDYSNTKEYDELLKTQERTMALFAKWLPAMWW